MIPVDEAYSAVIKTVKKTPSIAVDFKNCVGKFLREEIIADRNMPPFNRVMMDGIAIQFKNWEGGQTTFGISGVQAAGTEVVDGDPKECVEIMTGAMLPDIYDTVIRYEDISIEEKEGSKIATINIDDIKQFQNVHSEGLDRKSGDVLISKGTQIGPAEVGVIASVGESIIQVADVPKVAVISTGDELVEISDNPKPYQIRRSNVYSIRSALSEMNLDCSLFHFNDDSQQMRADIATLLEDFDILILSGGVSKGKFDFLPAVLDESGVKKVFHKVNQRPGKPFWFGHTDQGTTVFGLPGNPVSTFLCFYKYIKPWIVNSMGGRIIEKRVELTEDFEIDIPLTYFLQVKLEQGENLSFAVPVPGQGSGDFANLMQADGFAEIQPNAGIVRKGTILPFIQFR